MLIREVERTSTSLTYLSSSHLHHRSCNLHVTLFTVPLDVLANLQLFISDSFQSLTNILSPFLFPFFIQFFRSLNHQLWNNVKDVRRLVKRSNILGLSLPFQDQAFQLDRYWLSNNSSFGNTPLGLSRGLSAHSLTLLSLSYCRRHSTSGRSPLSAFTLSPTRTLTFPALLCYLKLARASMLTGSLLERSRDLSQCSERKVS